jgi:hypothetical protein
MTALASLLAALTLTTGLQGTVRRGPTQPVCMAGTPCTAPAPRVSLTFMSGFRSYSVTTDARGHYRIALPPGPYRVQLTRPPALGGGLKPARVIVPSAGFVTRNFSYDTGIR